MQPKKIPQVSLLYKEEIADIKFNGEKETKR